MPHSLAVRVLAVLAAVTVATTATAKPRPPKETTKRVKPAATKRAKPAKTAGEVPRALRPTPDELFVGLQLGVAGGIEGQTQFKLQPELGWHLLNRDGTGLAIGGTMAFDMAGGLFVWQLTPRVWWDFQPKKNLGLYIAPHVGLGMAISDESAAFNWGFGVQVRLAIQQSMYVVVQPFALDFLHGGGTAVRYDALVGAGAYL